ncbi:MAG: putative quinol monooxygenase [Opitutales bacterium]
MIKFAVYAKFADEHVEEFLAALSDYLPTVSEEPDTLQYDVCRSDKDPSVFLFYEAYPDEAAKTAHVESPAFKAYMGKIRPLLASPPVVLSLYEAAKG